VIFGAAVLKQGLSLFFPHLARAWWGKNKVFNENRCGAKN